jgi:hypothetical protein
MLINKKIGISLILAFLCIGFFSTPSFAATSAPSPDITSVTLSARYTSLNPNAVIAACQVYTNAGANNATMLVGTDNCIFSFLLI